MKFRKKPVEIDAIQYIGWNKREILEFTQNNVLPEPCNSAITIPTVDTKNTRIEVGDWLVKDDKGKFCPYKPDIFKQTYEAV